MMKYPSSIAHLTDSALHEDFVNFAQSEREILSQVLLEGDQELFDLLEELQNLKGRQSDNVSILKAACRQEV